MMSWPEPPRITSLPPLPAQLVVAAVAEDLVGERGAVDDVAQVGAVEDSHGEVLSRECAPLRRTRRGWMCRQAGGWTESPRPVPRGAGRSERLRERQARRVRMAARRTCGSSRRPSGPRFEDQVEGRLRRPADAGEARLAADLRQPRLARLGAEHVRPLLGDRMRAAEPGRAGIVDPADRVQVVLDLVGGIGLDEQQRAVLGQRLARPRAPPRPDGRGRAGSRRSRRGRTAPAAAPWRRPGRSSPGRRGPPRGRAPAPPRSSPGACRCRRSATFGKASAISSVEWPWPQPMSATRAPASSFATTPSSAGSHSATRLAR